MPDGIARRAATVSPSSAEGARLREAYEAQAEDPNQMFMMHRRMTAGSPLQREGPREEPAANPDLSKRGIGDRMPAFRDFWQRLWMYLEDKPGQGDATHIIRRAEESVMPTPKYRMPYPLKNPVRHRDQKGRKIEPGPAYDPQDILSEVG